MLSTRCSDRAVTNIQYEPTILTFNTRKFIVDFLTSKNDEKNDFLKGYYKNIFADQALKTEV